MPHVAGNNWTRKSTTPKPFNFSTAVKKAPKSIAPPVTQKDVQRKTTAADALSFKAPPVIPLEYDEEGEILLDGQARMMREEDRPDPNGRIEARLKRFLNKHSTRSRRPDGDQNMEYMEDEYGDEVSGPRGGEHVYYRRMAEARRMRAEKEESLNITTGRKWKNSPTQPQSFNWTNPNAAHVKSLARPVLPLRCDWSDVQRE